MAIAGVRSLTVAARIIRKSRSGGALFFRLVFGSGQIGELASSVALSSVTTALEIKEVRLLFCRRKNDPRSSYRKKVACPLYPSGSHPSLRCAAAVGAAWLTLVTERKVGDSSGGQRLMLRRNGTESLFPRRRGQVCNPGAPGEQPRRNESPRERFFCLNPAVRSVMIAV